MDTGFRIVEIIFILAGALMLAACGNKSGLVPVQTENIESNADNVMTDTRIQEGPYTEDTKVTDVINDEVFDGYGRLIFPVDMQISDNLTLKNINTILPWYSEINTDKIGEMVMDKLKDIDEVSYVRFASVYRQFKDINTFVSELKNILMEKGD